MKNAEKLLEDLKKIEDEFQLKQPNKRTQLREQLIDKHVSEIQVRKKFSSYKGIWLPSPILLINSDYLKLTEKVILSVILSLDNDQRCFATNDYFSAVTSVSIPTITRAIQKFIKMGIVRYQGKRGNFRVISIDSEKLYQLINDQSV